MSIRKFGAVCALFLGVFSSGAVHAQEFQIAVDGDFVEDRIAFTGGIAPPYTFVYDIRLVDGQVAICGSGHLRDSRMGSAIREILRESVLDVAGRTYPVDLNYFTRARTQNSLRTQPATCRSIAPYNGGSVSFRMGSASVRN